MEKKVAERITDALIGTDEKICSCSDRIAGMIIGSAEKKRDEKKTLLFVFGSLTGKGESCSE